MWNAIGFGLMGGFIPTLLRRFGLDSGRRRRRTPAELHDHLDRVELMMLRREGDIGGALSGLDREVGGIQGPDGSLLRARYRTVLADFAALTGQREGAIGLLRGALEQVSGITDPALAAELRARAEACLGLSAAPDDPDAALLDCGQSALAFEPRVQRPEVIMRLVWLAHWLGQIEYGRGRWGESRAYLERAYGIGLRLTRPEADSAAGHWDLEARELFWTHGRATASKAARELGHVLCSMGDRDAGIEWLDRSISVLSGAELPAARLALAEALLTRAAHVPEDVLAVPDERSALLKRAVESGLAAGLPNGRVVACQAEMALGQMYASVGLHEQTLACLQRAYDHVKDLEGPQLGFALECLLVLGAAYETTGDTPHARESFRVAMERGRAHPDPAVRKLAANGGCNLHRALLDGERAEEARGCLVVLDALVPTLAPDVRPLYAGITARCRGQQLFRDDQHEQALSALERAEAIGREADSAEGRRLVRWAVTDQGSLALHLERLEEAERHFRRALEVPVGATAQAQERAEEAEIIMNLGRVLVQLGRHDEGARHLRRAFDIGRDSGSAPGREVAAIAAMLLGELAEDEPEDRRRYYEAASRLGRLCGRDRGRRVAEAVDGRRREAAG